MNTIVRKIAALLLAAGAFLLIHRLGDVRIFNLDIDRYRGARWFRRQGLAGPLGTAALAAASSAFACASNRSILALSRRFAIAATLITFFPTNSTL